MPGRPKRIVVCGMSRLMTCRVPRFAMEVDRNGRQVRHFRPSAEHLVEMPRQRRGIDRTDDRNFQRCARKGAFLQINEIGARDCRQRVEFTPHRPPIGMIGKSGGAESPVRHRLRVVEVTLQRGRHLLSDALHRRRIQPRFVDGETQQFERLVRVARKRLQMAGEMIAVCAERKLDGVIIERAMKCFGIVGTGALVKQASKQGCGAGPVRLGPATRRRRSRTRAQPAGPRALRQATPRSTRAIRCAGRVRLATKPQLPQQRSSVTGRRFRFGQQEAGHGTALVEPACRFLRVAAPSRPRCVPASGRCLQF